MLKFSTRKKRKKKEPGEMGKGKSLRKSPSGEHNFEIENSDLLPYKTCANPRRSGRKPGSRQHRSHAHLHTAMDRTQKQDDVTKLRSCSALNTFYYETQQEIANLGQQIFTKNGIIAELKARLAKYERTCVIDGEEPYVVGPSKSLVDSLCIEIRKLGQKLKNSEAEAARKLESNKICEAPCVRYAVDLQLTVRVCPGTYLLLERLEKEKNKATKGQSNETIDSSDAAHLNTMVNKLQEENQQLKKRVAYVENLNSRWQKYDLSREEYVKGLCLKLKECNGLAGSGSALSPATTAAGSTALFQQEISRLNCLLEEKMLECEKLSREREDCALRVRERMQMLEQQVLAYIEDFKSDEPESRDQPCRETPAQGQNPPCDLPERSGPNGSSDLAPWSSASNNTRETQPTQRLRLSLKKPSRKQAETAEPLQRNSPSESSTKRTVNQSSAQGAPELQCPRCLTVYDDNHTTEYMNHWDECAKL
ncbi:hypothetical protein NFI96_030928 [Prochilodus magdalenae]|nr:hypothetical protein NFI96_030928 [Prochilodus magdalenae]